MPAAPSQPLGALAPNPAFQPIPPRRGISGQAAAALAIATLVVGLVVGALLGRASVDDTPTAAPLTTEATLPAAPGDTIAPSPTTSTPPGAELPPQDVGTDANPIGFGSSYIVGAYELVVNGVDRDADERVVAMSPLNTPPAEGERFVIVELSITFTEDSGVGSAANFPFALVSGDARWESYPPPCGRVDDDLLETRLLRGGETVTANVCFAVDETAVDALALVTEGFAGDIHFALE